VKQSLGDSHHLVRQRRQQQNLVCAGLPREIAQLRADLRREDDHGNTARAVIGFHRGGELDAKAFGANASDHQVRLRGEDPRDRNVEGLRQQDVDLVPGRGEHLVEEFALVGKGIGNSNARRAPGHSGRIVIAD